MSAPLGAHPLAQCFAQLDPGQVLGVVEIEGRRATGRLQALNSFENRVYRVEIEDGSPLVAKFYRPGRWDLAALDDEHELLFDLDEAGLPVALPLDLTGEGDTLGTLSGAAAGIHYALFEAVPGRAPAELDDGQLRQLGGLLGALHNVGAAATAPHRPVLDPVAYGAALLEGVRGSGRLPPAVAPGYVATAQALLARIGPRLEGVPLHRIHGDLHPGNLLWGEAGPVFLDFDDMLVGPAVQDVWMLVPSFDAEGDRQRRVLVEAYQDQRPFDPAWLGLVEPLRALRFVQYAGWIARRAHDPLFQRTFPEFGTEAWWQREVADLRAQIARIDALDEGGWGQSSTQTWP